MWRSEFHGHRSVAAATAGRARADRLGQERRRDGAGRHRSGASRSSPSTRCRCTAGWTSARPSRRPPSGRWSPTTASTSSTRPTTSPSPTSPTRPPARWPRSPAAVAAPCSSAAPGCTCGRSPIRWRSPAGGRRCAPSWRPASSAEGSAALHAELTALDPLAAARIEPSNVRRVVRALEVTVGSGRPFSAFGPGIDVYPPVAFTMVGLRWPRPLLAARIAARVQQMMDAGLLDEVERLAARPGGLVADRPPGARLQGAPRAPRRRHRRWTRPSTRPSAAPDSSPCARSDGSAATPAYAGWTSAPIPSPRCSPPSSSSTRSNRHDDPPADPHQAPRARQRLPRRLRARGRRPRPRSPAGCATAGGGSAPTGC